ncbi:MAG TPA: hypothetical protein VFV81_02770 [Verrucomicrobiae bacterium]|nr:hypothetical protein [Verrucomicrobiae bacterium]
MKKWFVLGGIVSALMLCAGIASAQNNGGGNNGGGNNGGGFRGRGNFDPAQFQQRMMDNVRDRLGFTNDTDWSAVQPLVQKVMDARREVGPGMRMFGGRNRGGNNGDNANNNRRGGMFGSPSPEAEALQNAIDNNAPSSQIKDLLAKYQASQKTKQATLKKAQDNLRQVLSVKQEAEATLLGLLD